MTLNVRKNWAKVYIIRPMTATGARLVNTLTYLEVLTLIF